MTVKDDVSSGAADSLPRRTSRSQGDSLAETAAQSGIGLVCLALVAIPLAPFLAFLALLNGGYATAFTAAGGQSIGKMAAGTRVVNADESAWTDRVPLGQAVVRAAGYAVSALPAGMGFLPAFFGPDGRAVHDRIAHTRVVKA